MYVIVGANGFLGAYIIQAVMEMTQEPILALGRSIVKTQDGKKAAENCAGRIKWMKCDITKKEDVNRVNEVLSGKKIRIVFLAAYHNPDLVEKNRNIAWNTNITALSDFMNTVQDAECFFYASSDSVYGDGGLDRHFKETDRTNPANQYGIQKAAAEYLVNAYGYHVVRFPFLIGPSLAAHKKHFYDKIVEALKEGRAVQMFRDSVRSSLDFRTAAGLLVRLMEEYRSDMPKILNVSGDEDLSKYDVGIRIAQKLGVPDSLIEPVYVRDTEGIFEAKRAVSALMDNRKMKEYLGLKEVKICI